MWRRALGTVKDQASIGIAIVGGGITADIDIALVKATSHDEEPVDERYAQELLYLISISRAYTSSCVTSIARRLSKTRNWVVAIKTLVLTHRLLTDGDPSFEHELRFGRSGRGSMRVLNMSGFRDDSHSHAWDYSAFVRTYALFLDEKLDLSFSSSASPRRIGYGFDSRRRDYDGGGDRSGGGDGYRSGGGDGYRNGGGDGHRSGGGDSYRNGGGDSYRNGGGDGYRNGGGDSYRNREYYDGDGDGDGGSYRNDGGDYNYRERRRREDRGYYGNATKTKTKTKKEEESSSSFRDMSILELVERIPLAQRLLERVLACRPTGYARTNRLVHTALYPVVKESFQLYLDISDGLARASDAFFDMEYGDCLRVFELYAKGSKQLEELASFYASCKALGICRPSEYPRVVMIAEERIEAMENFLRDRSEATRRKKHEESSARSDRAASEDMAGGGEGEEEEEEDDDDAYNTINGMKALPAPPLPEEPEELEVPSNDAEPDLLGLNNTGAMPSVEDRGNELALALFAEPTTSSSSSSSTSNAVGRDRSAPLAGWELALVESESELASKKPLSGAPNSLPGGFDNLLLTSMYEQANANRAAASMMFTAGSASSVALPGRPASSFLALPAPPAQAQAQSALVEDPFAASLHVPPPSYVQMSDMKQKQQLLVQEQQMWYQYQASGMQGYNGLARMYNTPTNAFQPLPYYGYQH